MPEQRASHIYKNGVIVVKSILGDKGRYFFRQIRDLRREETSYSANSIYSESNEPTGRLSVPNDLTFLGEIFHSVG